MSHLFRACKKIKGGAGRLTRDGDSAAKGCWSGRVEAHRAGFEESHHLRRHLCFLPPVLAVGVPVIRFVRFAPVVVQENDAGFPADDRFG